MSVQNMHLMTTAMDHVGAFWSSHTWCKAARDSEEIRKEYFGDVFWTAASHMAMPLCLFYRFHSSVALADIWSSAYRPARKSH